MDGAQGAHRGQGRLPALLVYLGGGDGLGGLLAPLECPPDHDVLEDVEARQEPQKDGHRDAHANPLQSMDLCVLTARHLI